MKPIPIAAGKAIAAEYGFDQVIIIARAVGEGEHVTTYGRNVEHCVVAARIGDFLKHEIMGWPQRDGVGEDERYRAFTDALRDILDAIDDTSIDPLMAVEQIATAMLLEAEGGPKRRKESNG